MKKNVCAAVLCAAALVLTSIGCKTTEQTAVVDTSYEVVQATIVSVDKYGNMTTSLGEQDFTAKGYETGDIVTVTVGDFVLDAPVGTNYSDVDQGSFLVRLAKGSVALAINMGNCAKTTGGSVDVPVTFAMKEKGGYLKEFQIHQLKRTENRDDYASDEIFANFRPVQAGAIAANRLYRACNALLGDARAPYAEKLIAEHQIKTIINLADSPESAAEHMADAPYYAGRIQNGSVVFLDMGVSFTDADFIAKLNKGLSFLAEHSEGPYLVHCNEGKDRAGYVNAVLEALNGATLEEMIADYMLSFENYFGVEKGSEQYEVIGKTIPDMFTRMNNGKPVTNKNIKKVTETYLEKTVGLSKDQIAAIRKNLQ